MTVAELKKRLSGYPDDIEVLTKKTELFGNVTYVNSIKEDSYGFFGVNVPCVLLTDEFEPQEQKTGHWKHNKCDMCGASRPPLFDNYCPHCGAYMKSGTHD